MEEWKRFLKTEALKWLVLSQRIKTEIKTHRHSLLFSKEILPRCWINQIWKKKTMMPHIRGTVCLLNRCYRQLETYHNSLLNIMEYKNYMTPSYRYIGPFTNKETLKYLG